MTAKAISRLNNQYQRVRYTVIEWYNIETQSPCVDRAAGNAYLVICRAKQRDKRIDKASAR